MGVRETLVIVGGLIFLGVFLVFFLRYVLYKLVDKRIANYQDKLMTKYYNEVENIYREMRGWRHDYHNHIQLMKAYLELEKYEEMGRYLKDLDRDLTEIDKVLKTGNLMVDAILNSKLSLAINKKININAKATVPEKLQLADIDLCVIIGNLMDNAKEHVLKLKIQRIGLLEYI